MDEEFKLCWKNFQDNIASGFQNLYDRGDLVDVTLACDGKLLHAHKIVLAICSPYFQEIFATNPCKHPIIILKDVTFNIMCELLEFMYQGVVNVKQAELQSFMKIGQLLQIKGLATNSSSSTSTSSEKSNSQTHNVNESNKNNEGNDMSSTPEDEKPNSHVETDADKPTNTNKTNASLNLSRSPVSTTAQTFSSGLSLQNPKSENNSPLHHAAYHAANALKRQGEFASLESSALFPSKKQIRRSLTIASDQNSDLSDANESGTGMDTMSTEDFLLPSISMVESRYDLNSLKRENSNSERDIRENVAAAAAAVSLRNTFGAPFGFDYNLYKNSSNASSTGGSSGNGAGGPQTEYPNDLHMPSDYSKSFANHMEIPSNGNTLVMLSSTSLLHGNCVFNRNNTVATQQGMKTYWLCKSYRVSMCRARCITHQGRIISATGVHNHPPHMRGGSNSSANNNATSNLIPNCSNGNFTSTIESNIPASGPNQTTGISTNLPNTPNNSALCNTTIHSLTRLSHNATNPNTFPHNVHVQQPPLSPPHHAPLFTHAAHHQTSSTSHNQASISMSQNNNGNGVIQNMFHNAANLMQLPNMLPPPPSIHQHEHHLHHQHQQHSPHLNHLQPNLEITSLISHSAASSSNSTHHHSHHSITINHSPSNEGCSMHDLPRSPSHMSLNEDPGALSSEHLLVRNEPLSPSSEINPATNNTVGSSADVSLSSQAEAEHDSVRHQAQVIDSLTISSPNVNESSQHFKIEDI